MQKSLSLVVGATIWPWLAVAQPVSPTLEAVRERGYLRCGISQGLVGFSSRGTEGRYQGIDVDYCKALAAAIFGNGDAVEFTELSTQERFTALQQGQIDLLARNTTWTAMRDAAMELSFIGVNYYDGQGFMTRLPVDSVRGLDGKTICVELGTTTELNLADFFRANHMTYNPVSRETLPMLIESYENGECEAFTGDLSALASLRTQLSIPTAHNFLPEVISKEPLGPVVRQGDENWGNLARWTLFALLEAEELEITQANVNSKLGSLHPNIRRLLGMEGEIGIALGVSRNWAVQVIQAVGNYGEIFSRNLGVNTSVGLERGLNALWTNGGLMYAMPMR